MKWNEKRKNSNERKRQPLKQIVQQSEKLIGRREVKSNKSRYEYVQDEKQNLQKMLGFAPSRAMNRQSQPNFFGAAPSSANNFSYLR
ncbi:hypothetical protein QQG55_52150 [Brugia pahangi]